VFRIYKGGFDPVGGNTPFRRPHVKARIDPNVHFSLLDVARRLFQLMHPTIRTTLILLFVTPLGILLIWLLAMWGAHRMTGDRIAATNRPIVARQQRPVSTVVIPMSTRSLYIAYCAQCHGESGDGQGTRVLDRPARSFKDGGFSFGNTTEALYRTISNGIGGTPMPGYADTLSAADRRRLAEYVQALGPEIIDVDTSATIMRVTDRPLVVRGHLPSLDEGLPEHPRGVIMASMDGMSFQYDVGETVKLLAVRQGDFVERTDWTNRGGSPLKPLGRVIHLLESEPALIELGERSTRRLLGTAVESDRAVIRYRITSEAEDEAIDVTEWGQAFTSPLGSGYRRTLTLRPASTGRVPRPVLRLPADEAAIAVLPSPDGTWVVSELEAGHYLARSINATYDPGTGLRIPFGNDASATLELTTFFLSDWNDATASMLKEMN